jgi:hypothetical protein
LSAFTLVAAVSGIDSVWVVNSYWQTIDFAIGQAETCAFVRDAIMAGQCNFRPGTRRSMHGGNHGTGAVLYYPKHFVVTGAGDAGVELRPRRLRKFYPCNREQWPSRPNVRQVRRGPA